MEGEVKAEAYDCGVAQRGCCLHAEGRKPIADEAGADATAVVEELVLPGGMDFGGEAAVPACEKNKTPAAFPRPGFWVNVLQSA